MSLYNIFDIVSAPDGTREKNLGTSHAKLPPDQWPLRRPCGAENVDSAPVASLANVFLGAPVAGTLAMQIHASTRKPPYGLSLINIQ